MRRGRIIASFHHYFKVNTYTKVKQIFVHKSVKLLTSLYLDLLPQIYGFPSVRKKDLFTY